MYSSLEFVTLPAKDIGSITVYPIVEIRVVWGESGGLAEVIPVAMVLQVSGAILTHIFTNKITFAGLSVG